MTSKNSLILALFVSTSIGCQKEKDSESPTETPKPVPADVKVPKVTIASVSLLENCPDPAPPQEAKSAEAKRAMPKSGQTESEQPPAGDRAIEPGTEMEADMDGRYANPCSQSTMQISITGHGDSSAKLAIQELRLLGPKGETLTTIEARLPTVWKSDSYSAWDQALIPNMDVKASYKISVPDWGLVETKIGGTSYGPMFSLEADFLIEGTKVTARSEVTARSPQIPREQIEMIET